MLESWKPDWSWRCDAFQEWRDAEIMALRRAAAAAGNVASDGTPEQQMEKMLRYAKLAAWPMD